MILHQQGQYSKALTLAEECERITSTFAHRTRTTHALCLQHLGRIHNHLGDYTRADSLYEEARGILQSLGEDNTRAYALISQNLVGVCVSMRMYDKAEGLYKKAMSILTLLEMQHTPDYATAVSSLGGLFVVQKAYPKAEDCYLQAREMVQTLGMQGQTLDGVNRLNLADLYTSTGFYEKAESLHKESMDILAKCVSKRHPVYAGSLHSYSFLLMKFNPPRLLTALSLSEEACSIYDEQLCENLPVLSTDQRLAHLYSVDFCLRHRVKVFSKLMAPDVHLEEGLRGEMVAKCFQAVALRKNLLFDTQATESELLHLASACRSEVKRKEFLDLSQGLKEARRLLVQSALDHSSTAASIEDMKEQVRVLEKRTSSVVAEACSTTCGALNPDQFLSELATLLPPGAALVEYVVSSSAQEGQEGSAESYAAFVLCRGPEPTGPRLRFCTLEATDIKKHMGKFRQFFGTGLFVPDTVASGHRLREALLDPVLQVLQECLGTDLKHLFLAPDGDLARLPFAALPVKSGGLDKAGWRYVVDEPYSLSYLMAGRDLLRLKTLAEQHGRSWAASKLGRIFSNPAFSAQLPARTSQDQPRPGVVENLTRAKFFEDLPSTAAEGMELEKMLLSLGIKVEHLNREKATAEALLEQEAPWLLHVASHGFYVPPQSQPGWAEVSQRLDAALGGLSESDSR